MPRICLNTNAARASRLGAAVGLVLVLLLACPNAWAGLTYGERSMGLAGGPMSLTAGPEGTLWFTQPAEHPLGCLYPDGTIRAFGDWSTVQIFSERVLAPGPDGTMWFIRRDGDGFGRIDLEGRITTYFEGRAQGRRPQMLAADVYGNLWFTMEDRRLGRLRFDPWSGEAPTLQDDFLLPDRSGHPISLTVDLTGAVWYGESAAPILGRLDRNGTVQEFPLDPQGLKVRTVTVDGAVRGVMVDGAKRPLELDPDQVRARHLGPEHTLVEGPLRPADLRVRTLVEGPDRAIWFTDGLGGVVGRYLQGDAGPTLYHLGESFNRPDSIISDGTCLWFAERERDRIRQVQLDAALPAMPSWRVGTGGGAPQALALAPGGGVAFALPLRVRIGFFKEAKAGRDGAAVDAKEAKHPMPLRGARPQPRQQAARPQPEQQPVRPQGLGYLFRTATGKTPDEVGTVRLLHPLQADGSVLPPATDLAITRDGCLLLLPDGASTLTLLTPHTLKSLEIWPPGNEPMPEVTSMAVDLLRNQLWVRDMRGGTLDFTKPGLDFFSAGPGLMASRHPEDTYRPGRGCLAVGPEGQVWLASARQLDVFPADLGEPVSWQGLEAWRVTVAADGVAWLLGDNAIISVDPATRETRTTPNPGMQAQNLAFGPGGLWFTVPYGDKLGLLEGGRHGEIRWFDVAWGTCPWSLVEGPDGAMWFTGREGRRIGRITADGKLTEFQLEDPHDQPNLIVSDRTRGKLYFTHANSSRIGSITAVAPPAPAAKAAALPPAESRAPLQAPKGSPAASAAKASEPVPERKMPSPPLTQGGAANEPVPERKMPSPPLTQGGAASATKAAASVRKAPTPQVRITEPIPLDKLIEFHGSKTTDRTRGRFSEYYSDKQNLERLVRIAAAANQYPLVGNNQDQTVETYHDFKMVIGKALGRDGTWRDTRKLKLAFNGRLNRVNSAYPVPD